MATADIQGNVFNVNAKAGFEPGIISGRVGAGARLTYAARAEFCHGITLSADAQALAEAQAALTLFLPAISAQGSALAAAGVSGTLVLKPDIFDKFGFSATLLAHAEASLAGSLAVALDFREITRLAQQYLSGLAFDLFAAFLQEVQLEAGVWGKFSASAMAGGYLEVAGSLSDNSNAGFVVGAGFDVGWGIGTGWDFYGGIKIIDARRCYNTISHLVTGELARTARRYLPPHQHGIIQCLEFGLPPALSLALDLGQQISMAAAAPPESKATNLLDGMLSSLQRTALDKVTELGHLLLADLITELSEKLLDASIDTAKLREIRRTLRSIRNSLAAQDVTLDTFVNIATGSLELVSLIDNKSLRRWNRTLAVLWTSLASIDALQHAWGVASASAGAVGAGTTGVSAQGITLRKHRGLAAVEAEFKEFFGARVPDQLTFEEAIDYLVYGAEVHQLIVTLVPGVADILSWLAREMNITEGDILAAFLLGGIEDTSNLELYRKVRKFTQHLVDDFLLNGLVDQLDALIPDSDNVGMYLNEVVRPSLRILSTAVFDNIDHFVDQGVSSDSFLNPLRQAVSLVVTKIMVNNVVVLADILLDVVHSQLAGQFLQMADALRNNKMEDMVTAAVTLFVPARGSPSSPEINRRTRLFLSEIATAAAEMCGPRVWSASRRQQLRAHMRNALLSIDGSLDTHDPDKVKDFLANLQECAYIPNLDDVEAVFGLNVSILADHFQIAATRLVPAFTNYMLFLGLQALTDLESIANACLRELEDQVVEARARWEAAQAAVTAIADEIDAVKRREAANLKELQDILSSPRRRTDILDRLVASGVADTRRAIASVPGFDLQPRDWRRDQLNLAEDAYRTAFNIVRPAINEGLKILSPVSGNLGTWIANAPNPARFLEKLSNEIERSVERSVEQALGGIQLPEHLSVRGIAQVAASMVTGLSTVNSAAVEAFELKKTRAQLNRDKGVAGARLKPIDKAYRDRKTELRTMQGAGPLEIKIAAPTAFRPGIDTVQHGQVPIEIVVQGVNETFVQPETRRIVLAINGTPLNVLPAAWTNARGGLAFSKVFTVANTPALRNGLNILECSVTNGMGLQKRQSVAFQFALD